MKSQRFPPLLRLSFPVPGSRSSARAVGRGRGKSQGAAPGPRCWGAAAALPSGPHPGRTGSHGGPNFSARGSRRGRPAAKLPRRLVEIFLNFFFFPRFLLLSPAARELSTLSYQARSHLLCKQSHPWGSEGGRRREGDERFAPAGDGRNRNPVSSAPPLPARAASPSSGGERRRRRLGVTFRAPFSLPACRGGPRVSQGAELNRD